MTPGFEGSFLGAADKISPAAVMECKICWTPYDPAEGDDTAARHKAAAAGTRHPAVPVRKRLVAFAIFNLPASRGGRSYKTAAADPSLHCGDPPATEG